MIKWTTECAGQLARLRVSLSCLINVWYITSQQWCSGVLAGICIGCRYVQFSVRLGSSAAVGSCPRSDSANELVMVQSTCNGGIDWHLLQLIHVSDKYTQPMYECFIVCNIIIAELLSSCHSVAVVSLSDVYVIIICPVCCLSFCFFPVCRVFRHGVALDQFSV